MLASLACTLILGASMGFHFKCAVLLPAMFVGMIAIGVARASLGDQLIWVAGAVVANNVAAQLGYAAGLLARGSLASEP